VLNIIINNTIKKILQTVVTVFLIFDGMIPI
jgi:hypothetical protein